LLQEYAHVTKTLPDIAEAMKDIDFCVLTSRAEDGSLGRRPMSNNREVEFEGTSWFYTYEQHRSVADIRRDPAVGLSYQGSAGLKGLVGAPGMFVHVQGEARLVDETAALAEHWDKELERWFPQGIDTPGITLIEVVAKRIHYWDGLDQGEVRLPATATA
jgi:general stress protein 26